MRGLRLVSALLLVLGVAACEEEGDARVRVRRVPNPPAHRVSDVVDFEALGPLLRRAASLESVDALRVVRQRPGYALVLRDASAEEASALAQRLDGVAIETERRAGSTLVRLRVTRTIDGPVALPEGTLLVGLDPMPSGIERPATDGLRWVQVSDTLASWVDAASLEETSRCVPTASGLSERSLVPESFDHLAFFVALEDGRIAGVARDPFSDETHVTVHALEAGCTLGAESLYTMRGRLADLTLDGEELVLETAEGDETRWLPQPGLSTEEPADDGPSP